MVDEVTSSGEAAGRHPGTGGTLRIVGVTVTAAGDADRPVTGLAAFVDADGIVFDGPVPGQRRHVPWSTVVSVTPGPDGYGPNGVAVSMAQLDLTDRSVMVSAPLGELDEPLAAVLATHRAQWVAGVAGTPQEPPLPPPPPEDLFGFAPGDDASRLVTATPVVHEPEVPATPVVHEPEVGGGAGGGEPTDTAGAETAGPGEREEPAEPIEPVGTEPGRRRLQRRTPAVASLVVVAAVLLVGSILLATRHSPGTGGTGSGPPAGSNLTSLAPVQALQAVVAAAHAAGSCHLVGTSSVLGQEVALSGDSSPSAADITQTRGSEQYRTVVTGSRTYVQGNAQALTAELGLTPAEAAANAGRWIELLPTDGPASALEGDALGQCAANGEAMASGPGGPLALFGFGTAGAVQTPVVRVASPADIGGRRTMTVTVTGNAPAAATGAVTGASNSVLQVTAALVVLAASPNLPVAEHVAFTGSDTGFSVHVDVTVAFSGWGETVDPAAPPGAVPYDTITSNG